MQLHWVIAVDILVCEEELLSESEEHSVFQQALLPESEGGREPAHWRGGGEGGREEGGEGVMEGVREGGRDGGRGRGREGGREDRKKVET